jgi:hypothetical protein
LALESGAFAVEGAPAAIVLGARLMADLLEVLLGGILEEAIEN